MKRLSTSIKSSAGSTQGALFWSDPSSWPGGVVPGLDPTAPANVTIPCNTSMILDVANLTLNLLQIQGLLRFLDSPALPLIYVRAHFVLVEGQLAIGTAMQQFSQKAVIELTPNTEGGRQHLQYIYSPPANATYPRDLGHKALAVVGGQLKLHGLPGPYTMPVWIRLTATASVGDTLVFVDSDVTGQWPIGGLIAIASSDYDRTQAETFTITGVKTAGAGVSAISLNKPLRYSHFGDPNLADGMGGTLEQRAEVALLSRNILIFGTDEPAPYNLEGGHLIIFMTPNPPQYIEGVHLDLLGQQGLLGRYPLHFHILGNVSGIVCRKNSITNSKQRCIVVHATNNVTVHNNVAYNTSGHCFMTEEGGEMFNTFSYNLGMLTNTVQVLISSDESDDSPSTFWMTNPVNTLIGNVAAGSSDTGIWYQLRFNVRGSSLAIPSLQNLQPIYMYLLSFVNNTAHSNGNIGVRTYPNGFIPRINWYTPGPTIVFQGINCYKNVYLGMFIHNVFMFVLTGSTFADNFWGAQLTRNGITNVTNCRFVGLSNNTGNPSGCTNSNFWTNCRPADITDCSMPVAPGVATRSTGSNSRFAPTFGILLEQTGPNNRPPYNIVNVNFSNYQSSCAISAGISMRNGAGEYVNPSNAIEKVNFFSSNHSLWVPGRFAEYYVANYEDQGEQSQMFAMYDRDGSLLGDGRPAFALSNNVSVLPPASILATCTNRTVDWNAVICPSVCYRALLIAYPEPNFQINPGNNARSQFSYIILTRLSDNLTLNLDGNLNSADLVGALQRYYSINVLANDTYSVEIIPAPAAPLFRPDNITLQLIDTGECGQGLNVQVRQRPGETWTLSPPTNISDFRQCPGAAPFPAGYPYSTEGPVCRGGEAWQEVVIQPNFVEATVLLHGLNPAQTDSTCITNFDCSLIWTGATWLYDDSGLERRPYFYSPSNPQSSAWKTGVAPFGFTLFGYQLTNMSRPSATLLTYLYRNTFSLSNSPCYSAINLELIVEDGVIVYLNGKEALRVNMPPGPITNATKSVGSVPFMTWFSYSLPLSPPGSTSGISLVDGVNVVAVETHVYAGYSILTAFDLRMTAVMTNLSCAG